MLARILEPKSDWLTKMTQILELPSDWVLDKEMGHSKSTLNNKSTGPARNRETPVAPGVIRSNHITNGGRA